MRSVNKISFLLLFILSGIKVFSQKSDPDYNELEHLNGLVYQYIFSHDTINNARKSEFILLFFKIDTSGHIQQIDFMRTENKPGNTLDILTTLTPAALDGWRSKKNKSRIIILPVYCNGNSERYYADYLAEFFLCIKQQLQGLCNSEFVMAEQVFYIGPNNIISKCPVIPPGISKN